MNPPQRIKQLVKRHWLSLVLIGLIAFIWFRPPASITHENTPLPNLSFTTLDGLQGNLESLRGKVVLVNFWATWCPYCRKEMPAMQEFYKDYQKDGFEILALSMDDDSAKAMQYMREHGYIFPAAMSNNDWQRALGPITSIPSTVIIDRDGHLRHHVHGQVYYGRIEDLVTPLLKPRKTP